MTNHKALAVELFKEGCNCSQAVFTAFCDEMNIEKEAALKLSSSFGGGFGRMREVCGAACAMELVAGVTKGYSNIYDKAEKDRHYALVQSLLMQFKEKNGSYICREILKTDDTSPVSTVRTADFYEKRPCLKCIESACEILDAVVFGR